MARASSKVMPQVSFGPPSMVEVESGRSIASNSTQSSLSSRNTAVKGVSQPCLRTCSRRISSNMLRWRTTGISIDRVCSNVSIWFSSPPSPTNAAA